MIIFLTLLNVILIIACLVMNENWYRKASEMNDTWYLYCKQLNQDWMEHFSCRVNNVEQQATALAVLVNNLQEVTDNEHE